MKKRLNFVNSNQQKLIKKFIMKKYTFITLSIFLLLTLTSCDAIGTIFEAGMWWAFILMALVVGLIIFIVSKFKK